MYLFIVRRYNDIDHIVPIIWKMVSEGDGPATILCTNSTLDIATDFRIRFLADKFGVQYDHLANVMPVSIRHKCLVRVTNFLRPIVGGRSKFLNRLLGHQNQLCSRKWAENVLKKLTAKVIVFDWCKLGSSPAGELANAAVQQNIPLIAVPHGLNCMTNDDRVNTQADNEPPARWGEYLRQMAFVIVQHQRHGKWMVECGVEPEKILVMGSTRFCSEWHAIYKSIIPADDGKLPKASSKLKIVYFDHTESLRLNVKAIEQALIEISKLDYVELIVKPTTGSNQYSSQAVQSISQSGVDIHSNKLVEWADVIMGSTSSILLEAFLYKKPLLYPRYFHENGQLYDQMNACIAVNDQSALLGAIEELHLSHCHIPYPEKNVEAFMTEILYGGNIDRDVLGEHRLAVIAAGTNSLRQKTDWNPAFDLSATPQLNQ